MHPAISLLLSFLSEPYFMAKQYITSGDTPAPYNINTLLTENLLMP